jgi:hypothetical protein
MATIDKRLLPLIEALAAEGADWLAFEMLQGLRAGRVVEETPADLQSAQLLVRTAKRARRLSDEPASPPPAAEPITGDGQIDWAVAYVSRRLFDALSMLEGTLDQLDAIVFTPLLLEEQPALRASADRVTLVLETGPEQHVSVHRENAVTARAIFPELQDALLKWADSVRTQGDTK